ncbi:MAG: NAD(P)/FAD-dependent oxidoreductase [Candidatus Saccharibacteria bacterium]|nr:NAD(P)/FAD-dependent oxidoreductase [Candidatus Saccharibacteria bacterium]
MKHIVIVGGGFAGVRLARKLKNKKETNVTLINDSPDFRYYPALYRAATGYKMGTARLPIEWMLLDASDVDLVVGHADSIDENKKKITLNNGDLIDYDYAVLALGSVTTYFNIEGVHEHSFGIKSVNEIIELRQHLHQKISSKESIESNYVIIGAGATGVELASALGGYLKRISRKHKFKNHKISIWLVEAAPRVMPQMSEHASKIVLKRLKKLGVNVQLNTVVEKETLHTLKTSTGTIKTHTVIWTAGTTVNDFYSKQGDTFNFDKRRKVIVNKRLQASEKVYVIGDNASLSSGLALGAIQHANFVSKDILRRINNKKRLHFKVRKPIQVVPLGNNWAILQYGKLVLSGRLIGYIRKIADFMGYADIMGPIRALTIWTNGDKSEDQCRICHTK